MFIYDLIGMFTNVNKNGKSYASYSIKEGIRRFQMNSNGESYNSVKENQGDMKARMVDMGS